MKVFFPKKLTYPLHIPLNKADGELLYCIRQRQTDEPICRSQENPSALIQYKLHFNQPDWHNLREAGTFLLWSAGDQQTYFEWTAAERANPWFLLHQRMTSWFQTRGYWSQVEVLPRVKSLIEQIMSHVLTGRSTILVFKQDIPALFLINVCICIQYTLANVFGVKGISYLTPEQREVLPVIEMGLFHWASYPYPVPEQIQSGRSGVKEWFNKLIQEKEQATILVRELNLYEQSHLGFPTIQELVNNFVHQDYMIRFAYQQEIIHAFLTRVGYRETAPSLKTKDNGTQPELPAQQAPAELAWQMIPDIGDHRLILRLWNEGYSSGQIAVRLGHRLKPKTVHNLISKWRREYPAATIRRER